MEKKESENVGEKLQLEKEFSLTNLFKQHASEWFVALDGNETDRSISIVAVSILDDLLKKLLKSVMIDHRKSDILFSDEHILQTTFSKINLAFYLGLIPSIVYEDLKTINRIRNVFAHSITGKITFDNQHIYNLLLKFHLGPRYLGNERMAKWRFIITAQQLICDLLFMLDLSRVFKIPKLSEICKVEGMNWQTGLTKEKIIELEKSSRIKWYQIDSESEYMDFKNGDIICVDSKARFDVSDIIVSIFNGKENLGKVTLVGKKKFLNIKGKNKRLEECQILGKVVTKITKYE